MPPASSSTSKRASAVAGAMKKFVRKQKHDKEFQTNFFQSQVKENTDLTDVNLICDGGIIPAHAILLQAVSPLFQAVIESQGGSFLLTRDIILPEFTLAEMQKVMQLVYTGSVDVTTEEEAKSVKKILAELSIENLGNIVTKKKTKKKGEEVIRPEEIRIRRKSGNFNELSDLKSEKDKKCDKNAVVVLESIQLSDDDDDDEQEDTDTRILKTRSGKKVKLAAATTKRKINYDDSDYEPPTSDEEVAEAEGSKPTKDIPKPSKSSSTQGTVIRSSKDSNSSIPKLDSNASKNEIAAAAVVSTTKNKKKYDSDSESDWREPNYKDKNWFEREAKQCQVCKKIHDNAAQASMCITGHQRLRCYFCFRVCKNTEKLFEHFKKQHKPAGRENCLLCPYCEQTIPFKSVSCHVISLHLSDMRAGVKTDEKNKISTEPAVTVPYRPRGSAGRPPAISVAATAPSTVADGNAFKKPNKTSVTSRSAKKDQTSDGPVAKKRRASASQNIMEQTKKINGHDDDDGLLRVPNLDVTIRRKGLDGRIWCWRIQKEN